MPYAILFVGLIVAAAYVKTKTTPSEDHGPE